MTQDHQETPRTAAGRKLLEREAYNSRSFALITPDAILAIEAEAARQVTELRAAVEAELALVIEPVGPFDSGAAAAYHYVLSVLAEAPRPCCADKGGAFCRDTTGLGHCVDGPEGFVFSSAGDKAEAPPNLAKLLSEDEAAALDANLKDIQSKSRAARHAARNIPL